jgi:glycosyltransferase involved in cell wall biosynthesis
MVRQGENGLLVPPGDSVALAQAIRSLLLDRDRAQHMANVAYSRLKTEFSHERMLEEYDALYEDLWKMTPN